ncbi:MAG TPA: glycosyltransferase family 9 protein [Candidatus Omnitrophota bacterium]|nr:glycosyltransferase family 9 protein [Candidatus Omnitrophota bacterium]
MHKKIKQNILQLYCILRLPVVLLIKLLFFSRNKPSGNIDRIVVIRLDRIGDFVTSLPVIDNLKTAYPRARLDVLVRPQLKGLAGLCRNIDGVVEYDGFFNAAAKLRKAHYDLAIDLLYDYTLMPAVLAYMSAAPVRAGFAWGFRELFFTRIVRKEQTPGKSMTAVHLEVLKSLGVTAVVTAPRIDQEKKKPGAKLVAGIHPGGHFPSQIWEKEKFAAVAQWLLQKYKARVFVFGGPDEKELVSFIVSAAQGGAEVEAVFPDTAGLVQLIAQCDLVLCNNSGPLHVAEALGIPTVSTMGPTDPVLWKPQGEDSIVIRKQLACSPCSRAVCKSHECMSLINVEEIENALRVQIQKIAAGAQEASA